MTLADKTKLIQDLQCKHAKGLAAFDAGLSFGLCVEEKMKANIQINYLINTLYRYAPFAAAVTNADKVTITVATTDPTDKYSISISYGATNLVSFLGGGTQESIVDSIVTTINNGTAVHGYYCVNEGNSLYLYTHDLGATFADIVTLVQSEMNPETTELSVTTASVEDTQLHLILDTMNCLELQEICAIVTEARRLLSLGSC